MNQLLSFQQRTRLKFRFFFALLLLFCMYSCQEKLFSLEEATLAIESGTSPIADFNKDQGKTTLYAYSSTSIEIPYKIFQAQSSNNISYRVDIENVTASVDGSPIEVEYDIIKNDNLINVYPKDYYSKTGKLLLVIHFQWRYWDKVENSYSSDLTQWKDYKQESISIEYDVLAQIAPLSIFDTEVEKSVNTHVFYTPQTKVNYLPNEVVEEQYKYEIESTMDNFVFSPYVEENDKTIDYNYEGILQSNENYVFTAKAKWYRLENNSWIKCADALDEIVTQNITTSELADTKWNADEIAFSYPLDRQFNFLSKEYSKGYIKPSATLLKQYKSNLPYIELNKVNSQLKKQLDNISYNEKLNIFEYDLPQNYFEPENIYLISFKDRTTDALLYSYYFKTSKFDNFTEKWESLRKSIDGKWRYPETIDDHSLVVSHTQRINMQELEEVVDVYETASANFANKFSLKTRPLIQFNSHVLPEWKNTMNWYIYSQPSLTFDRKQDPLNLYSFPPTDAIYLNTNSPAPTLSDNSCLTGDIDFNPKDNGGVFVWSVKCTSDFDVFSAISHAYSIKEEKRTDAQKKLASYEYYPFSGPLDPPRIEIDMALGGDEYPLMDVYYVLPGLGIKTTTISNVQF